MAWPPANHGDVKTEVDRISGVANGGRRGDVVYVWTGSAYTLAAGNFDDGVSPRAYRGGPVGAPEGQVGHVARSGDWHLADTS